MADASEQRSAFERLHRCFDERGTQPALVFDGRVWTHTELARMSRGYARGLDKLGMREGDRVATLCGSCPELVAALLGHYHLHAVHVPINTRYRATEIEHILRDCGARAVLVDAEHVELLESLPATSRELPRILVGDGHHIRRAEDHAFDDLVSAPAAVGRPADDAPALIIYTSGTTGRSKGVVLTHGAVVANISALTDHWAWSADDRLVLALPLFHVHGLCIGIHGAWLHGLTIDLQPRFEPAQVVQAVKDGGSIFMGVPTMYAMLLEHLERHPSDASTLRSARLYTAGSAALSARDFERFEALTGHRILERYGMSETLITLSNPYRPGDGERKPGCVGRAVPGCRVRIVDDAGREVEDGHTGEIEVQSNGIMREYWGAPEATAAAFRDGWFRTGDVAERDADGDVRIVGRRSVDVIKSGGFKISAREIEDCIAAHPGVKEVAVIGLPDPKWGQRITAAVVAVDGAIDDDGRGLLLELAGFVSQRLAEFKKPRALISMQRIPRNALGKVQKHRILALAESGEITVVG